MGRALFDAQGRDAWPLLRAAATHPAWCVLDFAEQGRSLLGVASEVRVAEPGREREFLEQLRDEVGDSAGWALALSYEAGVALMGVAPAPDAAAPAFALRIDTPIWLTHPARSTVGAPPGRRGADGSRAWRQTATQYLAAVEACREAIRAGEAYVLCLTDTAELRPGRVDLLAIYAALDAAQRGGVLVAGERALLSASPERFLSVRDGRVATHPIKGTRPRGESAREDAALAHELAHDPKERAENLMIVDLMRNDLSRVCELGTVETSGFLRVESHPYVHQLVSTVAGQLAAGVDWVDVIAACVPGGSMTGAPKHRAVELLAGLEMGPRGLYSGCFGWVDASGNAELAMTIRGAEVRGVGRDDPTVLIGAGGGITAESDAHAELAEQRLKAAPLFAALASSFDGAPAG